MVDDVKDITEKAESKEALDRARLARERREAEQRKRLDELRAHAAAAQAQREKRDEDRRRRMAEARSKDEDRRTQVEERKRAIWEASISRREALLQRERDRSERLVRARAARSSPRPAFAFGSSTPRLLEPVDSAGFFWAARSTNPIDQMNFFESLAASTTNVMFASAPLTRRASALHLDTSDTDNKDEPVSPQPLWSSVARRRTDLVPTLPARPGRAYSMTRLDRINQPTHHSRSQTRSGETTPSRPGSAMSNTTGVVRRASSAPRKPRPASIAGTGVNTPRGSDTCAPSAATTPSVSRDATVVSRPATTRRPRPLSLHAPTKSVPVAPVAPGDGKPPLHRKPKPSKEHDKNRKSMSVSPGRALSPSRSPAKEYVEKEMSKSMIVDKSVVSALEVTQKLEALRIDTQQPSENKSVEIKQVTNIEQNVEQKEKIDVQKPEKAIEEREEKKGKKEEREEKKDKKEEREEKKEKREERKEPSQEKTEDIDMTASMISRRITTEEEAKAALAERRRRAREELERQAEAERRRLQIEAEEEAERNRLEEERQRREEEEARELAALQRSMEEEKLRKAIEAQQQLEREEALRRAREEEERAARRNEEEERRRAAETAEVARRGEAEREERERLARKQRVEAIMARTRLKKQAEEDKKQQEMKAQQNQPANGESSNPNTQDSVPDSNTTQENIINMNVTQKSVVDTSVTQDSVVNTSVTQDSVVNTSVTQDSVVNTNVTQENVVNTSITQESVSSANSTKEIVANITESATKPNESATSAIIPNTNASEKSTLENSTESVNLVNVESVVKVENAQTAENVGKVANIDNSNGNLETGELLNLAASHVDSQSAPPTNNGNVADLLGLSTQLETVDKPEEHTPTKQIDNTPILDTNNGNANVGHISANFIQTERMAEVTNKLADDFATHNGHGHNHPLTLQNAI